MVRPTSTDPRAGGAAARARALAGSDVDTTDWPAQAADTIERVVQDVRSKTTGPAITAAKWFVAALFLLVTGITVTVLLIVMLVRMLDTYLPDSVFGEDHMWAAYGILGLVFTVLGLVLLRKRHPAPVDA
jgi:hypothetical protein